MQIPMKSISGESIRQETSFFCIFIKIYFKPLQRRLREKGKISCEYVPAIKIDWGEAKFAKIIKNFFLKVLSILISHNSHEGRRMKMQEREWLGGHKIKYFSDFLTCSFFMWDSSIENWKKMLSLKPWTSQLMYAAEMPTWASTFQLLSFCVPNKKFNIFLSHRFLPQGFSAVISEQF